MQRTIIVGVTILLLILIVILISSWYHSNLTLSEVSSTVTVQAETINQNEQDRVVHSTALAEMKASLATAETEIEVQATTQSKDKDTLATAEIQSESQRKLTLAHRLASQSQSIYGNTEGGAILSSLLAIESLHQSPTLEGNIALQQAIFKTIQEPFITLDSAIDEVIFSPDNQFLATSSEDNTVRLWSLTDAEEIARMTHAYSIHSLSFSDDGKWLATASRDKTARVLNVETGQQINLIHDGIVNHLAFASDNKRIATASGYPTNTVGVWEITTGNEIAHMEHTSVFTDYLGQPEPTNFVVAFSPDDQFLASTNDNSTVRIWDATSGDEITQFEHEPFSPYTITYTWHINNVAFSSDGQFLVTQGWSPATTDILYQARIWEISTHREITRSAIAILSPDNQEVALYDYNNIQMVQLSPSQKILWINRLGGRQNISFSPNGKLLGLGHWNPRYNDGNAEVWDAKTGKQITFLPHDGQVWQVIFSPDNQWTATRSSGAIGPNYEGGGVRLWDTMTGREVVYLADSGNMAFSFDGRWLAAAGSNGNVHLLPLQQEDLVEYACSLLPRNLTRLEWKKYIGEEAYHRTCANLPMPEN